jgi:hypothetical protein
MIEEIRITTLQGTGYFQKPIRQASEQGRIATMTMEAIFESRLEDEKKKVQPVYNSKGKLVEYDNSGIRRNIKA